MRALFHRRKRIEGTRHQRGFAAAASLFLLVVLALLGAALLKIFSASQEDATRDVMGAQAYQAARAGIEYGLYQTLRNGVCSSSTQTFPGLSDYSVALSCSRVSTQEGGVAVDVDTWTSVACNQAPCPAASPDASYVERKLVVQVSK